MPFPQPREAAVSHEDTSLGHIPQSQPYWRHPRQAKLGFAGKGGPNTLAPGLSASVTSLLSLHPSISPAALRPRRVSPIFSEPPFPQRRRIPRQTLVRRWRFSAQLCFAGGGGERIRTDDLLLAKQALSQLSYTPGPEVRDQNTEIRFF